MKKAAIKRWYLRGCAVCYKAAYAHTIYSLKYINTVPNFKKYTRKYGARRAKWVIAGIVDEHDNFMQMEHDYYGRY